MHEYGTARKVGKFVAFIGWVVTLLSVISFIGAIYLSIGFGFVHNSLILAAGSIMGGLLLVCQGQLTQAIADTASNTSELVTLLRSSSSVAQPSSRPESTKGAYQRMVETERGRG